MVAGDRSEVLVLGAPDEAGHVVLLAPERDVPLGARINQEAVEMTIDKSGEWWKGTGFDDLAEYIRELTAEGYPAERVVQSVCACGHTAFRLWADEDEGCARRQCVACGAKAFICDSEE